MMPRSSHRDEADAKDALAIVIENIRIIQRHEASLPISFLKSEAWILLLIKDEPGLPVKHYMSKSGLSQRGFSNVLSSLSKAGLIMEEDSAFDKRMKLLR